MKLLKIFILIVLLAPLGNIYVNAQAIPSVQIDSTGFATYENDTLGTEKTDSASVSDRSSCTPQSKQTRAARLPAGRQRFLQRHQSLRAQ